MSKTDSIVLSLCIPTYNRSWCLYEQLTRLKTCPVETLNKIEIIISDNCSTDDTQQIVEKVIKSGLCCRYYRNEKNIGMDGNFVNCFRLALGRYVWLLGDDDPIIIDSLVSIVNLLDTSKTYGLLHLYQKRDNKFYDNIVYVDNKDNMIKYISYYVTFISANIVNTKYIPSINFEKYMGTWFTLIPLYLTSLLCEKNNIIFTKKTFEGPRDYARNGGYNFYKVFVDNYLSIIGEFVKDKKIKSWLKKDMWSSFIWSNTMDLLIRKNRSNYITDNGWKILLSHYAGEWYFWLDLIKYPINVIQRKLKVIFT